MRSLVRLLLLVALVAGSHRADADPKSKAEAQRHVDKATSLFEANKPADALVELQAAIALDPRPELLYAIGQAHAALGQCNEATKFFERFIATRPAARPAELAKKAIAACKDAPRPEPTPKPEPVPRPEMTPKPGAPTPVIAVRATTPWYGDKLGDVLVGSGLIGGTIAVVLYRNANQKIDAANRATTYPERVDLSDRGHQLGTYSIVVGACGAVLVGAGIVRYIFHARSTEGGPAVTPTRGGGMATWSGRW